MAHEERSITVTQEEVERLGQIIGSRDEPLAKRFRVIFTLRNINNASAVDALARGLSDPSNLLKHEICFVMGQMQNHAAIPILSAVLRKEDEAAMVRHEAGEALGAIGTQECLDLLRQYVNSPVVVVAETCQLAVATIEARLRGDDAMGDLNSPYASVDPAPAAKSKNVADLRATLLDTQASLYHRYKAMFALRNLNTAASVEALCAAFDDGSALLRHELAYVLGQMQNDAAVEALRQRLVDAGEDGMVRHEAAEALGAIATPEASALLTQYKNDQEPVVKESCIVAIDMAAYYSAEGAFQYADGLAAPQAAAN